MTISPSTIYWIMQADQILNFFSGILLTCIITVVAMIVLAPFVVMIQEFFDYPIKKFLKIIACVASVSGLATAFIPSTKTLATMVVIPAIANSDVLQKDMPELYNLAKEKLKESITTKTN